MNFKRRSTLNLIHFFRRELESLPTQKQNLDISHGAFRTMKKYGILEFKRKTGYVLTSKGREMLREVQRWR